MIKNPNFPDWIKMVWCPPGSFLMGSPENEPGRDDSNEHQHYVILSQGFWMAKHATTVDQWHRVVTRSGGRVKNDGALPMGNVSWYDCQEWIDRMNVNHHLHGGWSWSLPTESQWEYACRAGNESTFCFDNNADKLGDYAWYFENSNNKPHSVATKLPNDWGLYDMHGNVWEWCADVYGSYPDQTSSDPMGPDDGECRVYRGGGWNSIATVCRSALRTWNPPDIKLGNLGFRPVAYRID